MHPAASFAELLQSAMERMNFTADRLASYTRHAELSAPMVSKSTIVRWLTGRSTRPHSWQQILRIAVPLQLTTDEASQLLVAAGHPSLAELQRGVMQEAERQLLAAWSGGRSWNAPALRRADELFSQLPADRTLRPAPLHLGSHVPLRPNAQFQGRSGELQELARRLRERYTVPTVAVTGLGGIGKSQLALEFAHRWGQYFAGGVFWISCADPESVPNEIAACGGPSFMDLRPGWADLERSEQIALVRAAWSLPVPRLLIFDNCEDEALLAEWRPTTGGCRVLLTARRAEWSATLGVRRYPLEVLERAASIALMRQHRDVTAEDDPALDQIASYLGDLPLALTLAGRYLQQDDAVAPGNYLAQLRTAPVADIVGAPELAQGAAGSLAPLIQTFGLSIDRLRRQSPVDRVALELLERAAHFAPGELIARSLLLATLPLQESDSRARLRAEDALLRLSELGLIMVGTEGALRLHRLIAALSRARAVDDAAQTAVEEALLALLARHTERGTVTEIVPHEAHVRWAIEQGRARQDSRVAALCELFGYHLMLVGRPAMAEPYVRDSLAIREALLPPEPVGLGESCNLLGLVCQSLGRFEAALSWLERAQEIWGACLDPLDANMGYLNDNLGHLLMLMARFPAADEHLRRALHIHHHDAGLRSPRTARALNNLGYLNLHRGRYRNAQRYLRLALALRSQLLPSPHLATAQTTNNVGEALYLYGDFAAAERYFLQSLALREELFGDAHHDVAESLCNLARLWHVQGDDERAMAALDRADAIDVATVGAEFFEAAQTYDIRGCVLSAQGDHAGAVRELGRAVAVVAQSFGPDHYYGARARLNLGLALLRQGALGAAESELERALRVRRAVLDECHPSIAESLWALGLVRQAAGDTAAAAVHWRRARPIAERGLASTHPLVRALAALDGRDDRPF